MVTEGVCYSPQYDTIASGFAEEEAMVCLIWNGWSLHNHTAPLRTHLPLGGLRFFILDILLDSDNDCAPTAMVRNYFCYCEEAIRGCMFDCSYWEDYGKGQTVWKSRIYKVDYRTNN